MCSARYAPGGRRAAEWHIAPDRIGVMGFFGRRTSCVQRLHALDAARRMPPIPWIAAGCRPRFCGAGLSGDLARSNRSRARRPDPSSPRKAPDPGVAANGSTKRDHRIAQHRKIGRQPARSTGSAGIRLADVEVRGGAGRKMSAGRKKPMTRSDRAQCAHRGTRPHGAYRRAAHRRARSGLVIGRTETIAQHERPRCEGVQKVGGPRALRCSFENSRARSCRRGADDHRVIGRAVFGGMTR